MAYVEVYVSEDDVLEALSDAELEEELHRRRRVRKQDDGVHAWTPDGFADDLRTAFYARNASRFEAILRALDRHRDAPMTKDPIAVFPQKEAH